MNLKFNQPVSLLLLWTFGHRAAPQLTCQCPGTVSTWSIWNPCTPSLNQTCNRATRFRIGYCFDVTKTCYEKKICRHPESCTPTWGAWTYDSACSNLCKRRRTRFCFNEFPIHGTVSTKCTGGNNQHYQIGYINCEGGSCGVTATTTAPTTVPLTSTTLTTSAATETTADSVSSIPSVPTTGVVGTLTTDAHLGGNVSTPTTNTTDKNTPSQPAAAVLSRDIILLIAILGAAAMLSVALVIVACMITRKRKSTSFDINTPTPAPRSFPTAVENSAYEMVGPPDRSPPPTPRFSVGSDQPRMVENRLYEPTSLVAQNSFGRDGRVGLQTNSDGYLRPISPPTVQDSVYQQVVPKNKK